MESTYARIQGTGPALYRNERFRDALPAQLTAMGYIVEKIGTAQHVLPHAVPHRFEVSSSGALVPVTEGSTKSVTVQVTNAGIATVEQHELRMP